MTIRKYCASFCIGAAAAFVCAPVLATDRMETADYAFVGSMSMLSSIMLDAAVAILEKQDALPTRANIERVLQTREFADLYMANLNGNGVRQTSRRTILDQLLERAIRTHDPVDRAAYQAMAKLSAGVAHLFANGATQTSGTAATAYQD